LINILLILYFSKDNIYYYQTNKLNKFNTMGCGCKNKGNQTNSTPQTAQQVQQQVQEQKQQQTENVKSAIKKTIEKYYNVNKSSK